ncbi:MAG: YraN family protein [Myxococcaceae bacterium]
MDGSMEVPRKKLGDAAERAVANYLEGKGYLVEFTNHLCRYGEVDVIARRDELWVFVEVRMRKNAVFGSPAATVRSVKQRRVAVAALDFLTRQRLYGRVAVRFDVVAVLGSGPDAQLEHYEGAFDSPF